MVYEKPKIIDAGMAEGVYTASGDCDCFTIEKIEENPTAAFGGYWLYFEVHRNAAHEHVVEEDWANLYIEITFNMEIPAGITVRAGDAKVSGNKIIIDCRTIIPADAGDWSYHGVQLVGDGSAALRYENILAKHYL